MASSSARQTHPALPPTPPWKDQLLEEEEVWAVSIYKTLCPGPGPVQSSFGGHSRCKGCNPRFSPCPSPPLLTPPPNRWHQPKRQFLQFPPHGTLLINCSNSERKEERAQTLKPWELVNQGLKFKTNALSCWAPPLFFFLFAVLLNHGILSEGSTPS